MDNPTIAPKTDAYNALLQSVGNALTQGRSRAAAAVNAAMVQTYWEIGRQIVEYEQKGNERAKYGTDVLNRLSRPVADDQTMTTLGLYLDGRIKAYMAIEMLLPQKLKDQYCFKTEAALSCLQFLEAIQ